MKYPAIYILLNGMKLKYNGATECGPLVKKEMGIYAFVCLLGPKNGIYTAKHYLNGNLEIWKGTFEKYITTLKQGE